jgi:hypothetical protein
MDGIPLPFKVPTCRKAMYSCQSGPAPMSEPILSSVNSYAFFTSSMPSGPLDSLICAVQDTGESCFVMGIKEGSSICA